MSDNLMTLIIRALILLLLFLVNWRVDILHDQVISLEQQCSIKTRSSSSSSP